MEKAESLDLIGCFSNIPYIASRSSTLRNSGCGLFSNILSGQHWSWRDKYADLYYRQFVESLTQYQHVIYKCPTYCSGRCRCGGQSGYSKQLRRYCYRSSRWIVNFFDRWVGRWFLGLYDFSQCNSLNSRSAYKPCCNFINQLRQHRFVDG